MDEKYFAWTPEITKKFFKMRFKYDWLFKQRKQAWIEFHKILMENGFPEEMTVQHVRKKWSYTIDSYRIAKKAKNKHWKYYRMFEKHYGTTQVIDKYDSWNDEWRLKLIICIGEAKDAKLDYHVMWRTVETALRYQDLPIDCCIQDLKGLWHYIRTTFNRKHRLILRKSLQPEDWSLYQPLLEYFHKFEPEYLKRLNTMSAQTIARITFREKHKPRKKAENFKNEDEFHWSKDITESFIQIRLQNDWMFRKWKCAWSKLQTLMVEDYGFPKTLSTREICRKWSATYSEYQKAKATNNSSWVYYKLFESYFGAGSLSLNPLVDWQEEWVFNLINAKTELDNLMRISGKNVEESWREVEKSLRRIDIPLENSLLELEEIWRHLLKMYKWKQKFADKGILSEQWPYFDAMAKYMEVHEKFTIKEQKEESFADSIDDDVEDDIKLLDLKQRLSLVRPKVEELDTNLCRSCSNGEGCVNIYDQVDNEGLDLAHKLRIIGGVEVDPTDNLSSLICLNCVKELENAYKFRKICQDSDKELRRNSKIKMEVLIPEVTNHALKDIIDNQDFDDTNYDDLPEKVPISNGKIKTENKMRRKKRYEYWKVCEICGKHTRNLMTHLDVHSNEKSYSCDICEKKFKFKSGLVMHRAVHNPAPRKTCEVCGKTFHIMAQYRRHYAYHANERKFECETCGKRFNSGDILRVHIRLHTDERPFSCPECGKTFRTAGCVSRHRRIVHRAVQVQNKDIVRELATTGKL